MYPSLETPGLDAYPLPSISSFVNQVAKWKYIGTLGLKSASNSTERSSIHRFSIKVGIVLMESNAVWTH